MLGGADEEFVLKVREIPLGDVDCLVPLVVEATLAIGV